MPALTTTKRTSVVLVCLFLAASGCGKSPTKSTDVEGPPTTSKATPSTDVQVSNREFKDTIQVGHLVGICMSPLFLADAKGYFKDEGLDVKLVPMSSPGDNVNSLSAGQVHLIHNSFSATCVAVQNGSPLNIVSGSGKGGIFCIAQPDSQIKSLDDLKQMKDRKLRVGIQRISMLEMMFYRMIKDADMTYSDFEVVYFPDLFALVSAFETKQVDLITHVEPYCTRLIKGGGVPIATSFDVWGKGSPDCVVTTRHDFLNKYPDTLKKYIRAILRADRFIKENMDEAVTALDAGKYYKVDKETLAKAIPNQPPGVDLVGGEKGMRLVIEDMVALGYLKKAVDVIDLSILETVLAESKRQEK